MFNTLVASGPPAKRLSRRGWIINIALHSTVLIALGIITGRAVMPMLDKPKEQRVVFADVKPPAPKIEPAPEKVHVAPRVTAPPMMKKVMTPVYHAPPPPATRERKTALSTAARRTPTTRWSARCNRSPFLPSCIRRIRSPARRTELFVQARSLRSRSATRAEERETTTSLLRRTS